MRVRPMDYFLFWQNVQIFLKKEAVFTVLSSNFKQLQRLKYKIPEKWLSEFQSYIYTCSIEPESRSEHFKKKTRCFKSTLTALFIHLTQQLSSYRLKMLCHVARSN